MARPTRAEEAATRHVGFRLTEEEIENLDRLVRELGFADRSAMLREWLERGGSSPRTNRGNTSRRRTKKEENVSVVESTPPTNSVHVDPTPPTNTPRTLPPNVKLVPRTSAMDSRSSPPVEKPSIMRELLAALHREHDPRLGLIRLPHVVRSMLAHASLEDVHDALMRLAKHGTIELRPDAGSEFLSDDDAALCPRGPRDSVFSYARWTDTSTR
jgi:hypothetical protein